jgi:predicted PolB exonuclease-like 3'-5' exonuclease
VSQEVRFLLFDVESVADGDLINTTKYVGEGLSGTEAIRKFRQELLMTSSRDFIPYTYHLPVAVVIAKIRADYSLMDIVSLDQPHHRPHVITKHFWTGWEAYERPTWVTFNGRSFDLPLMEHAAFRFGVPLPNWFNLESRTYEQYRNRYNLSSHLDLHELLTNFGSTWFRGGLNLAAALLGKPGKMSVQGEMVQSLYDQGKIAEINEYCRCDVLDTYFVFLRISMLMGKISLTDEQDRVRSAKTLIESQAEQHPAYQQYLNQWGDWSNPWEEEVVAESTRQVEPT